LHDIYFFDAVPAVTSFPADWNGQITSESDSGKSSISREDMTGLREHIEQLRLRLTTVASGELALVRALGDALSRVDEKLLQDVREVSAAHEARRGAILSELETLAARMGAFPAIPEPVARFDSGVRIPSYGDGAETGVHRGDWRQAAKNMEEDMDFLLNGELERNGDAWGPPPAQDLRFNYS
jgi:hypothetical protein